MRRWLDNDRGAQLRGINVFIARLSPSPVSRERNPLCRIIYCCKSPYVIAISEWPAASVRSGGETRGANDLGFPRINLRHSIEIVDFVDSSLLPCRSTGITLAILILLPFYRSKIALNDVGSTLSEYRSPEARRRCRSVHSSSRRRADVVSTAKIEHVDSTSYRGWRSDRFDDPSCAYKRTYGDSCPPLGGITAVYAFLRSKLVRGEGL